MFHQGLQTPRNRCSFEDFGTPDDTRSGNFWYDFSNETIQIYSVSHIWHFPFKVLSYAQFIVFAIWYYNQKPKRFGLGSQKRLEKNKIKSIKLFLSS